MRIFSYSSLHSISSLYYNFEEMAPHTHSHIYILLYWLARALVLVRVYMYTFSKSGHLTMHERREHVAFYSRHNFRGSIYRAACPVGRRRCLQIARQLTSLRVTLEKGGREERLQDPFPFRLRFFLLSLPRCHR